VLYDAHDASGFTAWVPTGGWKVVGDQLVADGSEGGFGNGYLTAPFEAPTSDSEIECNFQFVRIGSSPGGGYSFGIVLRDDGSGRYLAGFGKIWNVGNGGDPTVGVWDSGPMDELASAGYALDSKPHIYRVSAAADRLRLFVDSKKIVDEISETHTAGTTWGIWAENVQVKVRSCVVMAP
jgi:hypothetical protein